jgi:hypothetical protein
MRRKILVVASAMMLAAQLGAPAGAAEPTAEQLSTISNYLETNNVEGLRSFLDDHPELAQGDTPLAELLRRFLVESVGGNDFFRFRSDGPAVPSEDESTTPEPSPGPPGPDTAY